MPVFILMTDQKKNVLGWLRKISIPIVTGNTSAKLFFLFLSVFLWFLIKLSQEGYVAQVSFPVSFTSIPEDKRLLNKPVEEIQVNLRGKGFDILKHKLRSYKTVAIDMSRLELLDSNRYVWNTDKELEEVGRQFGDNVEVLQIKPKSVVFDFSPIQKRRLKVYLKGKKEYSNFKTLYEDPHIKPDSITIWGTAEELSGIDSIFTETVVLTADEDSMELKVQLQLPKNPNLRFSARQVKVGLRYSSLTERTVEIPIDVVRLSSAYSITLVPEKVNLTFRLAVEDFSKISAEDFSAFVDLGDLEEGTRFLQVQLQSVPALVRQTRLNPRKVEYILTEK